MELSQLKYYSVGIVAVNKPLQSKVIEVTPIEALPMSSGELTDNTETINTKGQTATGEAYQVALDTTSTIQATWLPLGGSNRLTAPDVRRGENVMLYRFSDTDQFWWTTLRDDMHLRKLETVIWGFSGTRDENAQPSADNMYWLEISTHTKAVTFHTSDADGEPFKYDIQINTKEGFILIQDDDGNFFSLDSTNRQIEMRNKDGSHVNIDKKQISISSPDKISLQSKTIDIRASNAVQVTGNSSVKVDSSGPVELSGSVIKEN